MSSPGWDLWLESQWGPSFEGPGCAGIIAAASNVVVGTNPPFTLQDFFTLYPVFGGTALMVSATTVLNSPNVTVVSAGMAAGQPVAGAGIPDGALIQSVTDSGHIVLTVGASATGTFTMTVWNACPFPLAVVAAYLALANGSLVQARWLEQWPVAMGLFVAHYLTLYARSAAAGPGSTIGQIAAAGLAWGITTSKAVGDVSVGYTPITGLEDWGAWQLSVYGQQLATMAKVIGSGSMFVY